MANQSETKSLISYCVSAKSHIIHMGAHEHHPSCACTNHQEHFHAMCAKVAPWFSRWTVGTKFCNLYTNNYSIYVRATWNWAEPDATPNHGLARPEFARHLRIHQFITVCHNLPTTNAEGQSRAVKVMVYSCIFATQITNATKKEQHQGAKIKFMSMKIQSIRVLRFSKLMIMF